MKKYILSIDQSTQGTKALLFDEMAKCSYYFEKLPCLQYGDILRNILYAGVWNVYDRFERNTYISR